MRRVNIDGVETRRRLGEMAGKTNGIKQISRQTGIPSETLNQICRLGYGAPETINRCIKAGLPIVTSDKAVPGRARKEHPRYDWSRKPRTAKQQETKPIDLKEARKQISIDDIETNAIKELLIHHLTALIEDLKRI